MPTPAESYGNKKQANSAKSVDNTTTGDSTILLLNEELSFLKHDFKASIDTANAARDNENNVVQKELKAFKASSDDTIGKLSSFMKDTFTVQDKVITSLKHGQEALDKKMDAIAVDVLTQMSALNSALVDFKATMVDLVVNAPVVTPTGLHVYLTCLRKAETIVLKRYARVGRPRKAGGACF